MSGHEDADESHRRYGQPYGQAHPIPTIQKYRAEKEARELEARHGESDAHHANTLQSYYDWWYAQEGHDNKGEEQDVQQPTTAGQNAAGAADDNDNDNDNEHDSLDDYDDVEPGVDTSEISATANVRQRRKGMKNREAAERQVTDPITHLPVTIRDFTSRSLKEVPENDPPFGSTVRTATGLANKNKSNKELQREWHELERSREADKVLFPPPEYNTVRNELVSINRNGTAAGAIGAIVLLLAAFALESTARHNILPRLVKNRPNQYIWLAHTTTWLLLGATTTAGVWAWMTAVHGWVTKKLDNVWQDSVWAASSKSLTRKARRHETETVSWLNSLLSSVWPLINPDLFTSLADTLEDVMQASIPSVVQMISVDDIGQGSESIRILGIRWLPTGAAARSVDEDGKLKAKDDTSHTSDRRVPGEGEVDQNVENQDNRTDDQTAKAKGDGQTNGEQKDDKDQQQTSTDGTDKQIAEGMEAEDGDFVNLEVSFAYRARSSKSFEDRSKDMHLYLSFYLPGNIKIPVWVDLRGIIGTMRLRLQLAPDPPFFGLCTLTFLGQPQVDISCIPLVKRGLNIMNLPFLSNFVQSSVDAALAEYVAPKSLTLDLKDMLAGDDFKKDTSARGVLIVHIKHGYDFREGDPGIPLIKEGGADPYVSVGWAKFGKPVFSTRILLKEMQPYWYETAYLLVSPQELDVEERLRVQLWDSDRMTADDDLGRIELDLKQLMKDPESNGKMSARQDGFRALKAGEKMPGKLEWSVGYFSKVRLQEDQFKHQTFDPKIKSMDDLDKKVDGICRRQLREAMLKDGKTSAEEEGEFGQNKAQEMKRWQDGIRISAPPPEGYPSGIFSIQIHQITGLGLEKLNKSREDESAEDDDEAEEGDHLPSAYCTVIINHSKVFKTRTKPKNAKPFYNAGTERYIADYRNAEVFVTVRDARVKEGDPLLGIVHLPLGQVFSERSQINGFYPLVGGIGFGRVRLSMVWTSVQLQLPPKITGWEYATLEVQSGILSSNVPNENRGLKLKFFTDIGSGQMRSHKDEQNQAVWQTHKSRRSGKRRSLHLPVRKHYNSCLAVQFCHRGVFRDSIAAFGVLWLRNLPDEDEQEVEISIWKETNSGRDFERARYNALLEGGVDCSPEKIGSLKIKLTLWSGMGGAHHKWAQRKDQHTRDVMEVLQCARDNYESHQSAKEAGIVETGSSRPDDDEEKEGDDLDGNDDGSDSDSSDSDSDGEDGEPDEGINGEKSEKNGLAKLKRKLTFKKEDDAADKAAKHMMAEEEDEAREGANDGNEGKSKQSVFDAAKEYKDHAQSKHRKNRGLMQYRIPRTAKWAFRKVEKQGHRLTGLFEHSGREPGIETEV